MHILTQMASFLSRKETKINKYVKLHARIKFIFIVSTIITEKNYLCWRDVHNF